MNTHAWEDAWEDDEEITDFAEQLRYLISYFSFYSVHELLL